MWALNPKTGVLLRRKETQREEGHAKMEVGVMLPRATESQSRRKLEEARKDPPLVALRDHGPAAVISDT